MHITVHVHAASTIALLAMLWISGIHVFPLDLVEFVRFQLFTVEL